MSKFFQSLDYWWFTDEHKPDNDVINFYAETEDLLESALDAESSDSSDEFYSLSSFYHQLRAVEATENRRAATLSAPAKLQPKKPHEASIELPLRRTTKPKQKTKANKHAVEMTKEKVVVQSPLNNNALREIGRLAKLNSSRLLKPHRTEGPNSDDARDQLQTVHWPKESKSWLQMLYVDEDEEKAENGGDNAPQLSERSST